MLLIEVYSPSVDRSYDFQIDEETVSGDAISSFCEMIAVKNGAESYGDPEDYSLYSTERRCELKRGLTLKENGVESGMKLILA